MFNIKKYNDDDNIINNDDSFFKALKAKSNLQKSKNIHKKTKRNNFYFKFDDSELSNKRKIIASSDSDTDESDKSDKSDDDNVDVSDNTIVKVKDETNTKRYKRQQELENNPLWMKRSIEIDNNDDNNISLDKYKLNPLLIRTLKKF